VNTPPPEGGGFGLRLKAGSVGLWADYCQLSRRRLPLFESNFADVSPPLSPLAWRHPSRPSPHPGPPKGGGFTDPLSGTL